MPAKHTSIRLSAPQLAHLSDRADSENSTITAIIRQLIDNDRRGNLHESKSLAAVNGVSARLDTLTARFEKLIDVLREEDDEAES